ncbi:MAG: PhzF family phenazine biosynthesis protein [Calditrichaceae bacterium]|nr:PhzF family phenazine biosynthesis protein [Calditrichaceae bacterium]MBN2708030.1 PhzF family phenazine biosynthesis protein [Calditrichaceae bacterium]RQV93971.1 MAG: PhzF family phenazine biosynthesis protein [Calditrichota bacterium]
MQLPLYQVDAFTDKVFKGNPAAVCPLKEWLDDQTMQSIGAENNLAETAFFVPVEAGFHIRWFTPTVEVDLCGHATLATAHVLFNHLNYKEDIIRFKSQRGELRVTKSGDLLTLDFPATKPDKQALSEDIISAMGQAPLEVWKSRDYLLLYKDEETVRSLQPNFNSMLKLDCLGVIATAAGDHSDFVSRFFAPAAGIPEDPVTGSAHTTLIPFWSDRLKKKKLHAFQVSKRGGELFCEDKVSRVFISGRAATYLQGKIQL